MAEHGVRERCIANGMYCNVYVQLVEDRPKGRVVIEPAQGDGFSLDCEASVAEVLLEG